MSISRGLNRLGTVLKVLGVVLAAIAIYAGIFGPAGLAGAMLFGVPAVGIWVIGWIVTGFGKA